MRILQDFRFTYQPIHRLLYNSELYENAFGIAILFVGDGEYGMHTVSNRVELWNVTSGKVVTNYTPLGNGRNVVSMDVTTDSGKLSFGSEDKAVTYYDVLESM
jgi:hypothetical protein